MKYYGNDASNYVLDKCSGSNELKHYGNIIADKNHETTEGHFIRFTTYEFEDMYYTVVMFDGDVMMVVEDEDMFSDEQIEYLTSDGYNPHL